MSKHKPTPTPETPPLKELSIPNPPTLERPAHSEKMVDAGTFSPTVPAPLNADEATETLLSALTQRLDAAKRPGESHLDALERVVGAASSHATLVKLLDTGDGWTPEFAADTLASQRRAIAGLLKQAGREDIDQARAVTLLLSEHGDMATALQPAFDALGAEANTRGILMSHVKGSGPDYDTGGQYQVTLVSVEDGAVQLSPLVDLGPKGSPSPVMSFGVAADHVLKRLEDFLRPKAHRS